MSSKNKKIKVYKSNDNLFQISNNIIDRNDKGKDNYENEVENYRKKGNSTKVSNKKIKSSSEIGKDDGKIKKVKFSNIDIIKVENWKQYNLNLTAEENLEELLYLANEKKEKEKNISCTCLII